MNKVCKNDYKIIIKIILYNTLTSVSSYRSSAESELDLFLSLDK